MRFRWRLLILLLTLTLTPILVLRWGGERTLRTLADSVLGTTREALVQDAGTHLHTLAQSYSAILTQRREQYEQLLLAQAMRLAATNARNVPATLVEAAEATPRWLAPNVLARFHTSLQGTTWRLPREGQGDGQGDGPVTSRQQMPPWFERPLAAEGLVWLDPVFAPRVEPPATSATTAFPSGVSRSDVSSGLSGSGGGAVALCAVPVRVLAGDGTQVRILGVSALAVRLALSFDDVAGEQWLTATSRATLLHPRREDDGTVRLRHILSQRLSDGAESADASGMATAPPTFRTDTPEATAAIVQSVLQGGSGHIVARMGGEPTIIGWAVDAYDTVVVLTMPVSATLTPLATTQETLSQTIERISVRADIFILVVAIITAIVAFAFSAFVSRPIRRLYKKAARMCSVSGQVPSPTGDEPPFRVVRSGGSMPDDANDPFGPLAGPDEIGHMSRLFESLDRDIRSHGELLTSMLDASEVQRMLLPHADPCVEELDVAGGALYCEAIGGDYYDYLRFGSSSESKQGHKLGIAIGDVAGHGIPAALLMCSARAYLRQAAVRRSALAACLGVVNKQLAFDLGPSGRFMTLFLAEADIKKMTLRFARAGQTPPLRYDPATDTFDELRTPAPPLGVDSHTRFAEDRVKLEPGQIIIFATDGLYETTSPEDKSHFGHERVKELVRANKELSAKAILVVLRRELRSFLHHTPPQDDVTTVILKVAPSPACRQRPERA